MSGEPSVSCFPPSPFPIVHSSTLSQFLILPAFTQGRPSQPRIHSHRRRCIPTPAPQSPSPFPLPFLKPTGIDRPDASSRWSWHSVVRAPIAPQVTKSQRNCGVSVSRNSDPTGSPNAFCQRCPAASQKRKSTAPFRSREVRQRRGRIEKRM